MIDLPLPLLVALGTGAVAVIIALWKSVNRPSFPQKKLPYPKRPSLLTPSELRFYRGLLTAMCPGLVVFVKVRL